MVGHARLRSGQPTSHSRDRRPVGGGETRVLIAILGWTEYLQYGMTASGKEGNTSMNHVCRTALAVVFAINLAILPLVAGTHEGVSETDPENPEQPRAEQISSNLVAGMEALGKQDYPEARTKCKVAQFVAAGSAKELEYFQFRAFHGMASACVAHAIVKGKLGDACPAVKAGKEDFIEALLMISGHAAEKKELYPFSDMIDAAGIEAGCEDE
jgi:hypothetical protein